MIAIGITLLIACVGNEHLFIEAMNLLQTKYYNNYGQRDSMPSEIEEIVEQIIEGIAKCYLFFTVLNLKVLPTSLKNKIENKRRAIIEEFEKNNAF